MITVKCPKCKGTGIYMAIYVDENGKSGCGGVTGSCDLCNFWGRITLWQWLKWRLG